MRKNLLACLFICSLNFCYAQSGAPDPSFGKNGIVKTGIGSPFSYFSSASQVLTNSDSSIYVILNYPTSVSKRFPDGSIDSSYGIDGNSSSLPLFDVYAALQPDGKVLIAGSFESNGAFYIARLSADGSIDSAFGINGIQNTVSFGGGSYATSVAIQNDGKILLAGATNNRGFCVFRFTREGMPDSSFNGTGSTIIPFEIKLPPDRGGGDSLVYTSGTVNAMAIQADGKIVLGGSTENEGFALARLNINGSIDSSFDNDGKQTTITAPFYSIGNSLAIQNDGKIILAGSGDQFTIGRYNINGSPDNSFNGIGMQTVNLSSDGQTRNSLGIQEDGKIVVAGRILNGAYNDFAVARLNANGSPDPSFNNDGILTTDIDSSDDYGGSVAVQGDGKILVAGYSYKLDPTREQFVVLRYNTDGNLDSSFNADGVLAGNFNQGNTRFNASAIQPDGKIIAAGRSWNGANDDFAIARYNSNGDLDSTFSDDGVLSTDFGATDEAVALAIQPDGKIVVAGNTDNRSTQFRIAIARYTTDGLPDSTFNGSGTLITSVASLDVCQSVALQADGKIVVAGSASADPYFDSAYFAILRFNTNGSPDNTFNGDGKQLTNFEESFSTAASVVIQKDNKIVVAGRSYINGQDYFSIARYNTDGNPDTTFSNDGKQNTAFGPDNYFGACLAIQKDEKLLVAGSSQAPDGRYSSFAVARYQSNGSLDTTFNNDGFQSTSLGLHFNAGKSLAVSSDGRIAVGGTNDKFAFVLYKNDGTVDSAFGNNGIKIADVGLAESSVQSIYFFDNKLYAAGYGQYPGNFGVVARYLPGPGTFITAANGNWNDPNTWIGGTIPLPGSQVIVQHAVTVSTDATCYSLKVEQPAGYVTIATGVTLTITN